MAKGDWESQAHERRCAHCCGESPGRSYPARDYLRQLQGMSGAEAMRLARQVEPFYWSDADVMHVMLCEVCASSLGLEPVKPPVLAHSGGEHEPQS